jgi:hypothetical protein
MNKIYLFVPMIAVAVFAAVYAPSRRRYDADMASLAEARQRASEEKARQQEAAKVAAHQQATAALERRTLERLDREAQEEAQRQARADAEQRVKDSFAREGQLRVELARLKEEVDDERADIVRLERQKNTLVVERERHAFFVYQAVADRKPYLELLEKLEAPALAPMAAARLDGANPEPSRKRNTPHNP